MMDNNEFEIYLIPMIKALWKKFWIVVLAATVFGASMFGYSKFTYVPEYHSETILYVSYIDHWKVSNRGDTSIEKTEIAGAKSAVNTCIAILQTRNVLEEVIRLANLDLTAGALAGKITTEVIADTELFKIIVADINPEQSALIANTIAQVLSEKTVMLNNNITLNVMDTALVPSAPQPNSIMKKTVIAAVLGALLVCGVVVGKNIYDQYKQYIVKRTR